MNYDSIHYKIARMVKRSLLPIVLLSIASFGLAFGQSVQFSKQIPHSNAVPYKILRDYMGDIIDVGLDPRVNEIQLMDTLAKAADDHQDDSDRDYFSTDMFWINAYLVGNGKNSAQVAGRLRRYVPRVSSEEAKKGTTEERRKDLISISWTKRNELSSRIRFGQSHSHYSIACRNTYGDDGLSSGCCQQVRYPVGGKRK